ELLKLVEHLSDEQLTKLNRGGHDPEKVYAAYKAAVDHRGAPTVILAKTVKGYGLGEAGEGQNITHQQKKVTAEHLIEFRNRFGLRLPHEDVANPEPYRPAATSREMHYLQDRRATLRAHLPSRTVRCRTRSTPRPT